MSQEPLLQPCQKWRPHQETRPEYKDELVWVCGFIPFSCCGSSAPLPCFLPGLLLKRVNTVLLCRFRTLCSTNYWSLVFQHRCSHAVAIFFHRDTHTRQELESPVAVANSASAPADLVASRLRRMLGRAGQGVAERKLRDKCRFWGIIILILQVQVKKSTDRRNIVVWGWGSCALAWRAQGKESVGKP